jgi:uncharacterized protein (DUF1684 family)
LTSASAAIGSSYLELLDYRRRVHLIYARVRQMAQRDPLAAHAHWRAERDKLFGEHPQSALGLRRSAFRGLRYAPYDPSLRFIAAVRHDLGPADPPQPGNEGPLFHRFGMVDLPVGRLELYWLDDYAGGVFLPFRDATNGDITYGGGRYLLDTAKGADLGSTGEGALILDFNFAYNPSCHYDPMWTCPLASPANRLATRVTAGELSYE